MKRARNWIIGLALSATAAFAALQTVNIPTQTASPIDIVTAITETPTLAYEGCAFTWAYYDAPELTAKLDKAVKEINSDASANATFFGEDCIYADGSKTFGAMQTDFTVRLPADDLTQHEAFGNWIKQVMQIVVEIPREEIQGGFGFVEFWFQKSETENIALRVPIPQYLNEAQDKNGAELFEYFYQR